MEKLQRVEICDVLRSDIGAEQEELDTVLPQFLHQKSVTRVRRIFHPQHSYQVETCGQLKQDRIIPIIGAFLAAIVLQDTAQVDCLLGLDVSLSNANSVDAFLAELVNVAFKVGTSVLPEHALKDA